MVVFKKHRATDVVQFVTQKLRRNRREFRTFMAEQGVTKYQIQRLSDTQFSWRDIATVFLWENLYFILLFLLSSVHLTEREKCRIVWLLHLEVQFVIALCAVFAKRFLLPAMNIVNAISIGSDFEQF